MMQVFSTFPEILYLAPFSATLLRIAVAYAFIYIASEMIQRRRGVINATFPIIGHPSLWMVWTSALITALIGCMLAIGLYTQVVAIIGAVIAIKHGVGSLWFPSIMPLSRGAYAFLFIVCLSLIVTGAGAIAFDLPL